jgi:sulfur relay (sulfurtransferase) DsrF/TusC family protein
MRISLTLFLVWVFFIVNAQNWSPLVIGKIANFKNSPFPDSEISNCIWITDTVILDNGDSCFLLNKIVTKSDDGLYLIKNQPQFLLEKMIKKENGVYLFSGSTNYVINTQVPLGSTWVFDTLNSLTAAYASAYSKNIFGIIDSVKLYTIFNSHEHHPIGEIILSKNMGIIKFPFFDNNRHYILCGFQNDTLGERVITFPEIYTQLSVNDVFEYDGTDADYGNFTVTTFTKKYTIINKTLTEDTVRYTIDGIYHAGEYNTWDHSYETYMYHFTETHAYISRPTSDFNKLPNQLIRLPNTFFYVDTLNDDKLVYTTIQLARSQVHRVKITGGKNNLYVPLSDDSDTLYHIDIIDNGWDFCGLVRTSRAERLGFINTYLQYPERYYEKHLTGYIIDGDTVGTITPDSILVSTPQEKNISPVTAFLNPNPATSKITITIKNNTNLSSWSLEIFNLNGVKVISRRDINRDIASIDISQLPAGLYLYRIFIDGKQISNGKLVKQ